MLPSDTQVNDNLVLPTLDESRISIGADNKKTLVYFFAPWCQVCHISIENLQDVYQKNQNVNVVAVALDFVDEQQVSQFVAEHRLTFPIALGNEEVKKQFKIKGYPSYYVLDEMNNITGRSLGYSSEIGMHFRLL